MVSLSIWNSHWHRGNRPTWSHSQETGFSVGVGTCLKPDKTRGWFSSSPGGSEPVETGLSPVRPDSEWTHGRLNPVTDNFPAAQRKSSVSFLTGSKAQHLHNKTLNRRRSSSYETERLQVLHSESINMCRDCRLLARPGYCRWTVNNSRPDIHRGTGQMCFIQRTNYSLL